MYIVERKSEPQRVNAAVIESGKKKRDLCADRSEMGADVKYVLGTSHQTFTTTALSPRRVGVMSLVGNRQIVAMATRRGKALFRRQTN